ncbi:universal stress protein [Mariprofundus erugo]|uniref:Universal stress protein n=1 Tax=Mariprofundus erugo TaxID=2528639 RepID=A0A5R9GRV9_9PROT|nr:universal stress protein [Mariprofundus erugo]TLS67007.1 universal stress protein [Mariprofundus erugo]TLS77291.1 universal stress protein [Mariprofundus erugo]
MRVKGNILVATDFSEPSSEALRRAVTLARQYGADVHLLHVMEPAVFFETDLLTVPPLGEVTEAIRRGAESRLHQQAKLVDFDVTTHLLESMGAPAGTICSFAATLPAALIVVGRQGVRGAIEQLLIGSTAERVVRHAPCSVLVTMPHGLFGDVAS